MNRASFNGLLESTLIINGVELKCDCAFKIIEMKLSVPKDSAMLFKKYKTVIVSLESVTLF